MKHNEGYPMTNQEFYDSQWLCVRLLIKNADIKAFKAACYKSLVRYIPVKECLKEKDPKGYTYFFTRHILQEMLFTLGKEFKIEQDLKK